MLGAGEVGHSVRARSTTASLTSLLERPIEVSVVAGLRGRWQRGVLRRQLGRRDGWVTQLVPVRRRVGERREGGSAGGWTSSVGSRITRGYRRNVGPRI